MYRDKATAILNRRNITEKSKIDRLLELNADIYTNLGTDSTITDKKNAQVDSNFIYRAIMQLDYNLGKFLIQNRC